MRDRGEKSRVEGTARPCPRFRRRTADRQIFLMVRRDRLSEIQRVENPKDYNGQAKTDEQDHEHRPIEIALPGLDTGQRPARKPTSPHHGATTL